MNIKEVQQELGMTIEAIAEAIGVHRATIHRWANGGMPRMAELAIRCLIHERRANPEVADSGE